MDDCHQIKPRCVETELDGWKRFQDVQVSTDRRWQSVEDTRNARWRKDKKSCLGKVNQKWQLENPRLEVHWNTGNRDGKKNIKTTNNNNLENVVAKMGNGKLGKLGIQRESCNSVTLAFELRSCLSLENRRESIITGYCSHMKNFGVGSLDWVRFKQTNGERE